MIQKEQGAAPLQDARGDDGVAINMMVRLFVFGCLALMWYNALGSMVG